MALSDKAKMYIRPLLAGILVSVVWVFFGATLDGISAYMIPIVKLPLVKTLASAVAVYAAEALSKKL